MKPYYKTDYGKLYHGDCLAVMKKLIDDGVKVDAIITDPPYGTTQCKWDVIIPFDEMWCVISEMRNDLHTPIVMFGNEPFSSKLRLSNLDWYKYDIVWDKVKGTGFLNAKKKPMRNHELIHLFYENQCLYNPQKTTGHIHKQSYRSKDLQTEVYGEMKNNYEYSSTERYPRSIQEFSTDTQNSSLHPTQKPFELIKYLIRTFTNENDLILDFTSGSGTLAIACEQTNRKWICIEREKQYCDVTVKRLQNIQTSLF